MGLTRTAARAVGLAVLAALAVLGLVAVAAPSADATHARMPAAVPGADSGEPQPLTTGSVGPDEQPSDTSSVTAPPTDTPTTEGPSTSPSTSGPVEPTTTAPTTEGPSESTSPASPTDTVSPSSPVPTREPGTAPAAQQSDISPATGVLALLALAASGMVLWLVGRAGSPSSPAPSEQAVQPPQPGSTSLLIDLGEAMIDAGYAVTEVQEALQRVMRVNGVPDGEIIVFPTALFVTLPGAGTVETAAASAGRDSLRLDQIDAVARLVDTAGTGALAPAEGQAALQSVRDIPPPFGAVARTLGYGALSVGLALILRGSAVDLLVAAVLGLFVGGVLVLARDAPMTLRAVLPLGAAFVVAAVVFLLGRADLDIGVLAPLVAPLVMFLPGGLLTTSVTELATGQLISGAGRLAGGLMQLVLLALGIVAGGQLVGVPAASVGSIAAQPLGDLAPWLGVAVFGAGMVVYQCAPRTSAGWILLVLYVAYGAQVIGGFLLGAVMSAFVGALVMTPVAAYVAGRPTGPATQVSFLPAFWMLVPGAMGLVGVTQLLGHDGENALSALVTTVTTMIAISFGVLIGRALVGALPGSERLWLRRKGAHLSP